MFLLNPYDLFSGHNVAMANMVALGSARLLRAQN